MGGVKREPWEHTCQCGKTFLSAGYNAQYCPECRAEANKQKHKRYRQTEKGKEKNKGYTKAWRSRNGEYCKEYRKKYHAEHREENIARSKQYRENHLERSRLVAKLKSRIRRGDKRAELEHAKLVGKVKTCERMRITALELPCGKRPECWTGKACPRTVELGLTRPKGREAYDFGRVMWSHGIIL